MESDYENLLLAASDPKIWEQHPQPNRYQHEVFKDFFSEAMNSKGALVIIDKANQQIIGTSRYYDYSDKTSSVIIGYTFMMRKYWGGRYNKELKKLMVNHALGFVKTTFFQVGILNTRSQKAMAKIGGINTGIQEIRISYGPPKKSYVYKIERPI